MKSILFNLYKKLTFGTFSIAQLNVESDLQYMDKLALGNKLQDGPARSFLQFKCQMRRMGKVREILLNLISLPVLFFLVLLLAIKSCKKRNLKTAKSQELFLLPHINPELVPLSLQNKYKVFSGKVGFAGCRNEFKHVVNLIIRFPLSFYFVLKIAFKVCQYADILDRYNVDGIVVTMEYSFTSSALTQYLEAQGKMHINVMHGEKLLFIRDAFVVFSKFYVWDEHYIKIFTRLNASSEQFVVELPVSIKNRIAAISHDRIDVEMRTLVYYLASESAVEIERISHIKDRLQSRNIKLRIRPHPRYSDLSLVKMFFSENDIEYNSVSISDSLMQADYACALYSTVLFEAYLSKVKVVIDDISQPEKFSKLSSLSYIMLNPKKSVLLSDLLSYELS